MRGPVSRLCHWSMPYWQKYLARITSSGTSRRMHVKHSYSLLIKFMKNLQTKGAITMTKSASCTTLASWLSASASHAAGQTAKPSTPRTQTLKFSSSSAMWDHGSNLSKNRINSPRRNALGKIHDLFTKKTSSVSSSWSEANSSKCSRWFPKILVQSNVQKSVAKKKHLTFSMY